MMGRFHRFFMCWAIALMAALGPGIANADRVVLVELFTAQGCASCPAADAMLVELAARPDVVALAFHVDYWDYLGWRDGFAKPAFSERQGRYARKTGRGMIYTPQMVFDGQRSAIGSDHASIREAIAECAAVEEQVVLGVSAVPGGEGSRSSVRLHLEMTSDASITPTPVDVVAVHVEPLRRVAINSGENVGKTVDYVNIVKDISLLMTWDGRSELLDLDLPAEGRVAIIVQETGAGPVLAARWLN